MTQSYPYPVVDVSRRSHCRNSLAVLPEASEFDLDMPFATRFTTSATVIRIPRLGHISSEGAVCFSRHQLASDASDAAEWVSFVP